MSYLLLGKTEARAVMLSALWRSAPNNRRTGDVLILHASEMQDPLKRGFRIREYRVSVDCKSMAVVANRAFQGDLRLRLDGMSLAYGGGLNDLADPSISKAVCSAPPSDDKDKCCFALSGQGEQPDVRLGTVKGFPIQLRPETVASQAPGACETRPKGMRFQHDLKGSSFWNSSGPPMVATKASTTCTLKPPYTGLEHLASFGGAKTSSVELKFCDQRLVEMSVAAYDPALASRYKVGPTLMGPDYEPPFSGYLADSFIRSGMFPSVIMAARFSWHPAFADPKFLGTYMYWEWRLEDWTISMAGDRESSALVSFKPQGSETCERLLEPTKDIR